MTKTYILQKDFGLVKAGEEIYWNSGYGKYYGRTYKHNHSECLSFTQEEIDRNPEWFKEVVENKSNDSFQWSDDLACEWAGYLEEALKCHHVSEIPKMLSTWKNKKTKPQADNKPDWEIVNCISFDNKYIHPYEGWTCLGADPKSKPCKIYSVKRLSDGITFSVDEITDGGNKIKAFELTGDRLRVLMGTPSNPAQGWPTNIQSLVKKKPQKEEPNEFVTRKVNEILLGHADWFEKLPRNSNSKKDPLFVTDDKVVINDGDTFWAVGVEFKKHRFDGATSDHHPVKWPMYHFFGKEEEADYYIKVNKPLDISMKEIASCITNYVVAGAFPQEGTTHIDWRKLDELIKSKQ